MASKSRNFSSLLEFFDVVIDGLDFMPLIKRSVADSTLKIKLKQGNRGDMRKIHVTRQFFEASGRHGDFFEETKETVCR